MTDYGIGYAIYKFENGTKTQIDMCKVRPGNVKKGMEYLMKRLDKIGNNRMFVNAALWVMTYGFAIRLLVEV